MMSPNGRPLTEEERIYWRQELADVEERLRSIARDISSCRTRLDTIDEQLEHARAAERLKEVDRIANVMHEEKGKLYGLKEDQYEAACRLNMIRIKLEMGWD